MAVDLQQGLSHQAAAARLAQDGLNQLPSANPRKVWEIAIDVVREPMFLLLIACGTLYLLLGDKTEAAMLLAFVFVIIGISFVQSRKSERALEALRDLSSPRALVIRDGKQHRIPGHDVVRGDLLVLSEGDRVPADAVLLSGINLAVDESLLTGESVPVHKEATEQLPKNMPVPGAEAAYGLYSGTLIVQGKGIAQVMAVGVQTQLGKIGKSLQQITSDETRLQRDMARIVKRIAWFSLSLSLSVGAYYGLTHSDWLNGFLVGITFAMAVLPEELPVVLSIFFALGAWRLSQKRVLTRRIPAIEMLGAATVLCVDKTGTLTQNRMALKSVWTTSGHCDLAKLGIAELPETYHEVLEFGRLASHRDPFDPMELAIKLAIEKTLEGTEHIHRDWTLVEEYPLSRELLAMSRVWQSPDREQYVIGAKGSPEAIFDLCHLPPETAQALMQEAHALAEQGLRVLGVAKSSFNSKELPPIQHDFEFTFLGLLGLADPVRPDVPAAIAESRTAGVRIVMITGDHPATAMNIARQVGLGTEGGLLSGSELDAMSDAELRARIRHVNVFCRAVPEHKLRLVEALKTDGEIVAMTGDGVNDAPALKAAHIGIAMGARGTDVAREAADLVLLDDDFAALVAAVRMGRRIFDNLRKAAAFLIGVHLPIVGLSIIPVALGWPLMLMPVHILFLQLIIDPACSVVFEAEPDEPGNMKRPPRGVSASLFDRHVLWLGFLQGTALLAVLLVLYGGALWLGHSAGEARALAFSGMVLANLGLIFANRSHHHSIAKTLSIRNRALWWVLGGAAVFLALVLAVPGLRRLFYFEGLTAQDAGALMFALLVCICAFEGGRRACARYFVCR
jgi:Ca2+-transporting ATPase